MLDTKIVKFKNVKKILENIPIMKNKIMAISIILITILVVLLVYFFYKYEVNIDAGYELVKVSPPEISFMLLKDATDQELIKMINKDPSIINQKCSDCNISIQTPLITAIFKKRETIIKYLIKKGASVEDAISLLKSCPHCKVFLEYFENILEDMGDNRNSGNSGGVEFRGHL